MNPLPPPLPRLPLLPLHRISDEAAVELYLFVEQLAQLIESRYGPQVRRYFQDQDHHSIVGPQLNLPIDDLPF